MDGRYDRSDFSRIFTTVLDRPTNTPANDWKDELAVGLVRTGINYLMQKHQFQTKLHQRLFQDVQDTVGGPYYGDLSGAGSASI